MSMLGPSVPGFGPSPNRLMLIGEAPGAEESQQLRPFVGPSGRELRRMLKTVGVDMDTCWRTNVFTKRPPDNNLAAGYGVLRDDPLACIELGPLTKQPTTFLSRAHFGQLQELRQSILAVSPNVIIALGGTATWALGLSGGISNLRGAVHLWRDEPTGRTIKVVPTFHPAAVLREWPLRVTAIADLEKAINESASPELQFDNTELWLRPTLDDLEEFGSRFMENATICATDVETRKGQISCLSFAPDVGHALVIPFWIDNGGPHYWPDPAAECAAWRWTRRWIEKVSLVKVTQNGVYDMMYFRNPHGMTPRGFVEDTMLQSHSLYSELRKGLGYLASIYCNVPHWKDMRTYKKEEQLKRED